MYLETIDEKAFRSFLSNPAISVLDGNVLDKYNGSNFYRFVRVPFLMAVSIMLMPSSGTCTEPTTSP